jgi:hypothetical protein
LAAFGMSSARLWGALAFSALAGGAARVVELSYPHTRLATAVSTLYQPLYIIATSIALYYCLKVHADHAGCSMMRMAWLLLAASCVTTLVRHTFEWAAFLLGWWDHYLATLVSLRQIPSTLALVLLTAGLAAMWSSFASVGLGLRFRWRDAALSVVVVALFAAVWAGRHQMNDSGSAYPLMRHLQSISLVLLALPALLCLALRRISEELERGQLALSLQYLVWSLVLRLLNLGLMLVSGPHGVPVLAVCAAAAFWASPWLFALAIFQRWKITVTLHELAELYERNPEEGLARLLDPR